MQFFAVEPEKSMASSEQSVKGETLTSHSKAIFITRTSAVLGFQAIKAGGAPCPLLNVSAIKPIA
jgi:hypothetical protein